MTQEIYDYLWIRNFLLTKTSSEIIATVNSEEIFYYYIKCISNLMQEEDFLIAYPSLQKKVSELVHRYRYNYHSKKYIDDINYVVTKLFEYKYRSDEDKFVLEMNFFQDEHIARDLPIIFKGQREEITKYIINDINVYPEMFCMNGTSDSYQIDDIVQYISTINLLISDYPNVFLDYNMKEIMISNIDLILNTVKLPFVSRRYLKRTLKKLNNIENITDVQVLKKIK